MPTSRTTAQTNAEQQPMLPMLIVVALAMLAWNSFTRRDVPPTPEPAKQSELRTAIDEFGDALESHIEATISKLEAGDLATDADARDYLSAGREAALKAAFLPIAQRDQAALQGDWSAEKHVARLRDMIGEVSP